MSQCPNCAPFEALRLDGFQLAEPEILECRTCPHGFSTSRVIEGTPGTQLTQVLADLPWIEIRVEGPEGNADQRQRLRLAAEVIEYLVKQIQGRRAA